jgi:type II secretory pathway component PulF
LREARSWSSNVDFIPLRRPLKLRIRQDNNEIAVFCKEFPGMIGSGKDLAQALEMFFDHLMIDYYEHSLNPGRQSIEQKFYGEKIRRFFNGVRKDDRLLAGLETFDKSNN